MTRRIEADDWVFHKWNPSVVMKVVRIKKSRDDLDVDHLIVICKHPAGHEVSDREEFFENASPRAVRAFESAEANSAKEASAWAVVPVTTENGGKQRLEWHVWDEDNNTISRHETKSRAMKELERLS